MEALLLFVTFNSNKKKLTAGTKLFLVIIMSMKNLRFIRCWWAGGVNLINTSERDLWACNGMTHRSFASRGRPLYNSFSQRELIHLEERHTWCYLLMVGAANPRQLMRTRNICTKIADRLVVSWVLDFWRSGHHHQNPIFYKSFSICDIRAFSVYLQATIMHLNPCQLTYNQVNQIIIDV